MEFYGESSVEIPQKETKFCIAALVSGLVGFGAVVAGHKLGLEYAGRLVAMTFILVVIGADGRAGEASYDTDFDISSNPR